MAGQATPRQLRPPASNTAREVQLDIDDIKPLYACPACQRGILNRAINRCLYCDATLPASLLFSDAGPPGAAQRALPETRQEPVEPLPEDSELGPADDDMIEERDVEELDFG